MACTTLLVGKKASYDGSTLIARNDDNPTGVFQAKKHIVVEASNVKKQYRSKISKIEIELEDKSLRYTCFPSVDNKNGIWAASGINSKNVSMTATETITTNPRVQGGDPLLKIGNHKKGDITYGGIGEEDLVVLVLPYISSAKDGVIRLGSLLEKYGTYESNGIAFSDKDEIWWLESIGGHNWIARRVKDEEYVVMPNQFGLDKFDFDDAYNAQKENMCSGSLKNLVKQYNLDLTLNGKFSPRLAFGSHDDSDHIYNTPRAWFMERYLNPKTFKWEGDDADYAPESDDIPWSLVPERKITIEDVKYLLSSHFQGTEFDPYNKDVNNPNRNKYRAIGVNRTSVLTLAQIRDNVPSLLSSIMWFAFGSNVHNVLVPVFTNVDKMPSYFSNTTLKVSTDNFYWSSRLIGSLADPYFNSSAILLERYSNKVMNYSHFILNKYDKFDNSLDEKELEKANDEIAKMVQEETDKTLNDVLYVSSMHMKNSFSRSDN